MDKIPVVLRFGAVNKRFLIPERLIREGIAAVIAKAVRRALDIGASDTGREPRAAVPSCLESVRVRSARWPRRRGRGEPRS